MDDTQCLSHSRWECKYHVVWIQSAGGRCFMVNSGGTSAKFCMNLPDRKSARFWKVTYSRIMCIF